MNEAAVRSFWDAPAVRRPHRRGARRTLPPRLRAVLRRVRRVALPPGGPHPALPRRHRLARARRARDRARAGGRVGADDPPGSRWSGLDLTRESVDRVGTRLRIRSLPHVAALKQGSAVEIPSDDDSFDLVFSPRRAPPRPGHPACRRREIHRVLRPGGAAGGHALRARVAELPGRASAWYAAAPSRRPTRCVVRRLVPAIGMLRGHLDNAERMGLRRYLRLDTFTHHNTDGPLNPFARVYSPRDVARDFPDFTLETRLPALHARTAAAGARDGRGSDRLGWHLWVHLRAQAGRSGDTSGTPRPSARRRPEHTGGRDERTRRHHERRPTAGGGPPRPRRHDHRRPRVRRLRRPRRVPRRRHRGDRRAQRGRHPGRRGDEPGRRGPRATTASRTSRPCTST